MTKVRGETCSVCAKPIPRGARKCTECGEFQSPLWRILVSIDLKGLLALLPLLTLIYAFLSERIAGEYSELLIASVRCDNQSATVFVSNTGNRRALLRQATFSASGDPVSIFELPADLNGLVFEAGAARLLELDVDLRRNPGGIASFQSRQQEACSIALKFDILNFDHSSEKKDVTCDCPSSL